jgi:flavin-dependent trigonelline monooxygenase, reductase component
MSVEVLAFRYAMATFATGITIVTARDRAGRPRGLTANAIASISLKPPSLLVCVSETSDTLPAICDGRAFAVNILAEDQIELARLFAGKGEDKFESMTKLTTSSKLGLPLVPGALSWMECVLIKVIPAWDHTICIGEVTEIQTKGGAPLVFFGSTYRRVVSPTE